MGAGTERGERGQNDKARHAPIQAPVGGQGKRSSVVARQAGLLHRVWGGRHREIRRIDTGVSPGPAGGSVKPDNAQDIMNILNVDGVLVGGASLKADSFNAIIEAASA